MNARRHSRLSREARVIWWEAYRDAFRYILAGGPEIPERSLGRAVELAAEAAWKSLNAYRIAIARRQG